MNYLSQYDLPFQSLRNGQQEFDLKIENKFFDFFEQQAIQGGELDVNIDVNRNSNDFVLDFKIEGNVSIQCDVCLDWYSFEINIHETINAKIGKTTEFDSLEDYIQIGYDDSKINISPLLFEFILLNLPMKHTHPLDDNGNSTCNEEMLMKLEELVIKEENKIDPRWDKLKELKRKTKENGTS